jgi:hypothetical protein
VTTPAVGVLLLVFIREGIFKGPSMQVESDHIGWSERALGQIREKQFVDDGGEGTECGEVWIETSDPLPGWVLIRAPPRVRAGSPVRGQPPAAC